MPEQQDGVKRYRKVWIEKWMDRPTGIPKLNSN